MDIDELPPQSTTKKIVLSESYQPSYTVSEPTDTSLKQLSVCFASKKDLKSKEVKTEKEKIKRVVTHSSKWDVLQQYMSHEQQLEIVEHLASFSTMVGRKNDNFLQGKTEFSQCIQYVVQQIHNKQNGYKTQDIQKGLYSESEFINYPQILELLQKSQLKCYYCLENVQVLYEHVREQKQWSLERIDNSRGHNADNVEIACLICNLRRRTMNSDKYVATKQTKFVKTGV